MFRPARLLIAILTLVASTVGRAQQSGGGSVDAGAPAPLVPDTTASAPPAAGPDSLVPPSQGAPTPGPESRTRTTPPSSPAQGGMPAAKAPSDQPVSRSGIQAVSVQPPPADSPFFIERQEAREAMANAGREGYGMYVPKPPRPPAQQQIKQFFRGLFGGKEKQGAPGGPVPMTLTVDPSDFSLAQTPELDVSLRISNARKHEIEILFPDNQRLEILTKDSSGNVVGRWSEDRAFDPQVGFTEINPRECVIYAERVPTARMKAGQTYTIEASLANQEGYTASATVTPRP